MHAKHTKYSGLLQSYDPTGAHPIGRGYPLIIPYIIEWILVSAVI